MKKNIDNNEIDLSETILNIVDNKWKIILITLITTFLVTFIFQTQSKKIDEKIFMTETKIVSNSIFGALQVVRFKNTKWEKGTLANSITNLLNESD